MSEQSLQPQDVRCSCYDGYASWLEIRDGTSSAAPLIGRYCYAHVPSTISSTGSHLHLRFVGSLGWPFTVELASCGGSLVLRPKVDYTVSSPNFPDMYPSKTECEWTVRAPRGHFVEARMNHLWLSVSENCSDAYVTLHEDNLAGEVILAPTCSRALLDPAGYRTSHNTLHVKFASNRTLGKTTRSSCLSSKCGFELHVKSTKFECGGLVEDNEGDLYVPGYPYRMIPRLSCQWDLRAGVGHRYALDLHFPGDTQGFYQTFYDGPLDETCLPDLEVWNGPVEDTFAQLSHHIFCANTSTFVSTTDIVTILYHDQVPTRVSDPRASVDRSRTYKPFHVHYVKIRDDAAPDGCTYDVVGATVISIRNLTIGTTSDQERQPVSGARTFCHIRIVKPSPDYTMRLEFTNLNAGGCDSKHCFRSQSRVLVTDSTSDPWPVHELLCNGSLHNANSTSVAFVNNQIDIYVFNNPWWSAVSTVQFDLAVNYSECGGIITEDSEVTQITSPHFENGNYPNDTECLWVLQAPAGKVVSLTFVHMDIEYNVNCESDMLEISEGHDRLAVLHRYCYETDGDPLMAMPERFRSIRSQSSTITLYFKTDSSVTRKGFKAILEFAAYDETSCGFVTHALSGTVHSPNFPKDYPVDSQCIWDISVPLGYHIRLVFLQFDIEQSLECRKDYLQISQEHKAIAIAPVHDIGYHEFHDEEEEILNRTCGIVRPAPIDVHSNRARLNFTSDATVTGRGFKLEWSAGTWYSLWATGP
ncbi:Calcium binding EGF domain containing protein [Aphelenchoides avenae]|nr:Calcium binding EGF domain containing protein [Aphelenchus avenae]